MLDQLTQNATMATKAISASINDTATKVANTISGSVDETVTKVRNVEFDLTKLDASALAKFDPRNLATVTPPEFDLPEFSLPKVELPDFDLPVERANAVARDMAYAGIGVVVIAAQQVDANIRRLATRDA